MTYTAKGAMKCIKLLPGGDEYDFGDWGREQDAALEPLWRTKMMPDILWQGGRKLFVPFCCTLVLMSPILSDKIKDPSANAMLVAHQSSRSVFGPKLKPTVKCLINPGLCGYDPLAPEEKEVPPPWQHRPMTIIDAYKELTVSLIIALGTRLLCIVHCSRIPSCCSLRLSDRYSLGLQPGGRRLSDRLLG
jgi:hypothetical protein